MLNIGFKSDILVECEVMANETPAEIAKRLADKAKEGQTASNVAAQEKAAQDKAAQDKLNADKQTADKQANKPDAASGTENKADGAKVVNNDPDKPDQQVKPQVAPPSSPADAPKSVEISRQVDQVMDPLKPTTPQSITVKEGEHQRDVKGSEGGSQNPATLGDIKARNEELKSQPNVLPPRAEGIGRSGAAPTVVSPIQAPEAAPEVSTRRFQSAPPQANQIQWTVLNGTRPGLPFEVANNETRVARAAFANGEDASKFSDLLNSEK